MLFSVEAIFAKKMCCTSGRQKKIRWNNLQVDVLGAKSLLASSRLAIAKAPASQLSDKTHPKIQTQEFKPLIYGKRS